MKCIVKFVSKKHLDDWEVYSLYVTNGHCASPLSPDPNQAKLFRSKSMAKQYRARVTRGQRKDIKIIDMAVFRRELLMWELIQ